MSDIDPWERRDDESEEAFEAFALYRDMGTDRNIRAVGRQLAKSHALISRWSARDDWPNRAREYDRWQDRQATRAWVDTMTSMVEETNAVAAEFVRRAALRLGNTPEDQALPRDAIRALEMAAKVQRDGMTSIKPERPEEQRDPSPTMDIAALVADLYQRARDADGS